MRVLVGYTTTEGQTRKVARFVADRLADGGHAVELLDLQDADELDLGRFDAAILGGSLHGGGFQKGLTAFARGAARALAGMPTLFLPVSLTAAGTDEEDWKGLDAAVERLIAETGWKPGRIAHVAGAFRFEEYDFFRAWAMRWIASQKDETVDPHGTTEYTDWEALAAIVDEWAADAEQAARA